MMMMMTCLKLVTSDVRNNSRTAEKWEVLAQLRLYSAVEKRGLKNTDEPVNVV
jgi:hypothetical protein